MTPKQTADRIIKENNGYNWDEEIVGLAIDHLDLLAKQKGHVLVPLEPSEETLKAIEWQIGGTVDNPIKTAGTTKAIYKAMIASKPESKSELKRIAIQCDHFRLWWNKQNDVTLRMATPEIIAKAAWGAAIERRSDDKHQSRHKAKND